MTRGRSKGRFFGSTGSPSAWYGTCSPGAEALGGTGQEPFFRYALYVDLVHATRGAYMAKSLGLSPKVVSLIKRHHDPRPNFYEPELALLQEANSRN